MKQTTASQTPKNLTNPQSLNNPSTVFVNMAMDMSWRLAVVVIVPIVAGFKVDEHLSSSPLWTIVGFVLAMAGMAAVLRRMLREVASQDFSMPAASSDMKANMGMKDAKKNVDGMPVGAKTSTTMQHTPSLARTTKGRTS